MNPVKTDATHIGESFTFPHDNPRKLQRPITGIFNENGCLECISHKTKDGIYPRAKRNNKDYRLHKYIFIKYCQEIPVGYVVRHKCDNPKCINPDHLELGTIQDNNNDKMIRGRQYSKLTYDQAYYIKYFSEESVDELVKKFSVSSSTIKSIKAGKTWRHVVKEKRLVV